MMRRFCCYIEKVFDFSKQIHGLRDARKRPRIPTQAIWGSVFFLFVMRHRSLNGMGQDLREPKRMERVIGKIKPRAVNGRSRSTTKRSSSIIIAAWSVT